MRFLRIPTEESDGRSNFEIPAWIIDGLASDTPRMEAPRLELPPGIEEEPPRLEEVLKSTIIIIDL